MVDRDVGGVRVRIGGDNTGLKQAVEDSRTALGGLNQSASVVTNTFKVMGTVIGTALAGLSVGKIMQYADSWSEMRARISNAKGEMESTDAIMRRLNDVATRTYSSLNQTAESWLRNSTALKEMGYSTKQQLDLTETLNNALVVSATRGERAQRVMDAWSKAMATGKLQGDNLNSIIEGSDRLAKALADSLGVTTMELRKMATDGKITSDVMFGVTSELDKLRTEAEAMPATLADAAVAWDKAFQVIIGTVDTALQGSTNLAAASVDLARAFEGQAENITTFFIAVQQVADQVGSAVASALGAMNAEAWAMEAAFIAAGAGAALLATNLAGALVSGIMAAAGAMKALGLAMLANPFTVLIAGIGAAIAAAFLFRDEIKQAIGIDFVDVMKTAVNSTVGAFVGAFNAIKGAWGQLPSAIGDLVIQAANITIGTVESMINNIVGQINNLMNSARQQAYSMGYALPEGVGTPISPVDLGRIDNPNAGAAAGVGDVVSGAFSDSMGVDYVGALADGLGKVWENATGAREEIAGMQAELGGDDGEEGGGGGGAGGGGGKGGSKAEKQAEQLNKQLEQLKESFLTEEELEAANYQKKLEQLQMFYDQRMLMESEYLSMIEQARIEHEEKLDAIRREAMEKEIARYTEMSGYIKGTLSAISSVMDSEGDKQIGIQKAISLAIAGINVAEGITKALTLPFPMNILAAAQTAAQGFAAIQSITKSSRGNAGINSAALTGASGANASAANPQVPQTMVIRGYNPNYFYSGEQMRNMAEGLIQYQKDGGQVVWSDQ